MNSATDRKTTISLEEMLFLISLGIMILGKGVGVVEGTIIYKSLIIVSALCVLTKILIGKYTAFEYVYMVAFIALGIIIWRVSGNQSPILFILLLVSMKNVSVDRTFKMGAVIWSAAFVFQILTHLLNLRQHDFVIHQKFGLGYLIRWALGYSHPNVLQISYAVLIAYFLYSYLFVGKKFIKFIILSFAGAAYIFIYSLSVTGFMMYLLLILFYIVLYRKVRFDRSLNLLEQILCLMLFPLCVIFSIIMPLVLQGRAFDVINGLMQTRPALTRYFLTSYSLTPFGQDFSSLYYGLTLDSSFANLLMNGGVIIFAIVILLYLMMIFDYIKKFNIDRNYKSAARLAIVLSFSVAAISEPYFFNTSYKNVTWIFLGAFVWHKLSMFNGVEYQIVHFDRSVFISFDRVKTICSICLKSFNYHKKKILLLGAMPAIIIGIVCGIMFHAPSAVYALRSSCDTDETSVSLFINEDDIYTLTQDKDIWVLNYADEETPMLKFEGSITGIDRVRAIVSATLWTYIAVILLTSLIISQKDMCR